MNSGKTLILASLLLAVSALGLWAQEPKLQAPKQQAAISEEEINRLAQKVMQTIVRLPHYGVFDEIRFGFGMGEEGLAVILGGQASRPTLSSSAERAVKKIEGVAQVVNEIEVLPNSSNDDDIRRRVYINNYGHPALSRLNLNRGTPVSAFRGTLSDAYDAGFGDDPFAPDFSVAEAAGGITNDPPRGFHPIRIIVKDGNVRLEGVVNSSGDKTIAGMQARGTFGALGVENDLVVANETRRKLRGEEK